MNDTLNPTIGPDRIPEPDLRRDLDQLDGQLGGQNPTTLDYRPSSTGEVNLGDLAKGLEPSYAPGRPPTPDAPGGDK